MPAPPGVKTTCVFSGRLLSGVEENVLVSFSHCLTDTLVFSWSGPSELSRRLHPPDDIEPSHVRIVHIGGVRNQGMGLDWKIKIRGRRGQAVAEKSLRRDAHKGYGLGVNPERAPND